MLLGEIVRPCEPAPFCWMFLTVDRPQDLDQEDDIPLRQVEWNVLEPYHKNDMEMKKQREESKSQILFQQKGFCKEGGDGDGY